MDIAQFQALIGETLDKRVAACRAEENESQARKWERERAFLTQTAYATYLMESKFDLSLFDTMAIYVAEKVRKIVGMMAGKSRVDNYTPVIIGNAKACEKKKMEFTSALQEASLSKAKEVENAHKLPKRLSCTVGTANSQASSSRLAMKIMGMAHEEKAEGGDRHLVMNWESPILQKIAA